MSFTSPSKLVAENRPACSGEGAGIPIPRPTSQSLTCPLDLSERRLQPVTDSCGLKLLVRHPQERGPVSSSFWSQSPAGKDPEHSPLSLGGLPTGFQVPRGSHLPWPEVVPTSEAETQGYAGAWFSPCERLQLDQRIWPPPSPGPPSCPPSPLLISGHSELQLLFQAPGPLHVPHPLPGTSYLLLHLPTPTDPLGLSSHSPTCAGCWGRGGEWWAGDPGPGCMELTSPVGTDTRQPMPQICVKLPRGRALCPRRCDEWAGVGREGAWWR